MHENGMVPSVQFLQSLLKLFAARKNFAECLRAWELFEPKPDQAPAADSRRGLQVGSGDR